ncbi:hypothetical protein [Streptacidiphilus jiangxiensis]|uniref:Uncharacterized protein n=1 Tax=Streptacidiphilus jiangxiensis TaxID=235985 RepID=A0A1H7S0U6_STRJI|nr:hypothetical protein [Streptacidiphilus jiangxiensis]SEL65978.1 hypothetical protein SAMN05414137_11180 [Streptacidiphilus jiangxiensis]
MGRRGVRNGVGTAGWLAVGLLVTGCAAGTSGGTQVVTGGGGLTPTPTPKATTRVASPVVPGAAAPAGAATPGGPCPTPAQWQTGVVPTYIDHTPASTPQAEALSQAVGTAGRESAFADVYGTQITDYPVGRVALCVTDLAGGRRLAEAAKRIDPRIDVGRLDLYLARYSAARLSAAAQRLVPLAGKGALGFPINGVGAGADASSLEVDTNAAGVASAAFRRHLEQLTGGVPVTLVNQGPAVAA